MAIHNLKLNLQAGYHQILKHPKDRHKISFCTHHGLSNKPAITQALINSIFQFALQRSVLFFFYDILIYIATWGQHLKEIEVVLNTLQQNKLFSKLTKCTFGLTVVKYLGHVVFSRGVQMDITKVAMILQWASPTNVKQVRIPQPKLVLSSTYQVLCPHRKTLNWPT